MSDANYIMKQLGRAITNLDKRLRIVENREMPTTTTGGGGGPIPDPIQPVTPAVGWSAAGAPFAPLGYWSNNLRTVSLQGRVIGSTFNTLIFTLPIGYRPAGQLTFESSGTVVQILADGRVWALKSSGAAYVNLDGINFRAA